MIYGVPWWVLAAVVAIVVGTVWLWVDEFKRK